MPSPIIQQYFNDTTIDKQYRTQVFEDLHSGKVDEATLESSLKNSYPDKFGTTSKAPTPTSAPFDMGTFYQDKEVQTALKQSAKIPDTQLPQGGMSKQPEGIVAPEPVVPQGEKPFAERFGEQVLEAPGKMLNIAKEAGQDILAKGAKAGLGFAAPIVDPISEAITGKTIQERLSESPAAQAIYGEENVKNLVPKDALDWAGAATETITTLLAGKAGQQLLKAAPEGFQLLKQLATQGAKFGGIYGAAQGAQKTTTEEGAPLNPAQRVGEIAKGGLQGAITGTVLTPLMGTLATKYMNNLTGVTPKVQGVVAKEGELPTNIEQVVKETWQSGTRPTGKAVDVPLNKVGAAMLDTVENKPKLKFTDASGELIEGQLPRTHAEYTQVAQNRMDDIFNQYDAMAKSAGEKGAVVEFAPISAELNKLANNQALRIKDPATIKYAQEMASRLESEAAGTPKNVQETIKMLNSDLQNFYRNPGYESSGRAFVDAAVAKELRTRLDSAISSLEGAGYQDLKNTYGAWASILDAIEHRATLEARKNKIGLVDSIYNMGSIADLGRALVTRSPASFTTSAMQQAAKFFTKWVNSPDAILKRNFSKLEDIVNKGGMPIKGSVLKAKQPTLKMKAPLTEKVSSNAGEIPTQLVNEAKKYKSAEDFFEKMGSKNASLLREQNIRGKEQIIKFWEDITGKKNIDSYTMSHRPTEDAPRLSNLLEKGHDVELPEDFISHLENYFRVSDNDYGKATGESIKAVRNIANSGGGNKITIYRASPKEAFNSGDWVTLSKKYADIHAKNTGSKVFSKQVSPSDVRFAGDDINEFGYFPQ